MKLMVLQTIVFVVSAEKSLLVFANGARTAGDSGDYYGDRRSSRMAAFQAPVLPTPVRSSRVYLPGLVTLASPTAHRTYACTNPHRVTTAGRHRNQQLSSSVASFPLLPVPSVPRSTVSSYQQLPLATQKRIAVGSSPVGLKHDLIIVSDSNSNGGGGRLNGKRTPAGYRAVSPATLTGAATTPSENAAVGGRPPFQRMTGYVRLPTAVSHQRNHHSATAAGEYY
ncbi:uncharacterized protein LOC111255170 [Varroa destructor]|uniref:Secreted protein n=1 Tax=Varroa destructor TaxID=109461 RepID=A0A7M7MFD8_VARDE|nr:uncharacterized protein LOC111255170 [Varroa destructor]